MVASEHIVRHLLDDMKKRHTMRGSASRAEVGDTVRTCLELLTVSADATAPQLARIRRAASRWASLGVPVETVQHLVHEGFTLYLDSYRRQAAGGDPVPDLRRLFATLYAVTSTISQAYVQPTPTADSVGHAGLRTLAAALLSGRHVSTISREYGIPIADRYTVLAVEPVAVAGRPAELDPARLRLRLAGCCGQPAPALLTESGGTVLIPGSAVADERLDELVAELSAATGCALTAAAISAPVARIPQAANDAHDLLDVVARLRGGPGLYRFRELALEFQLTRPGPGRERLGALLDPLDAHPELMETLCEHIRNNFDRQRTSQQLYIHANTVDYRLKRIGTLIGLDVAAPEGRWRLRAAMIAHNYTRSGD